MASREATVTSRVQLGPEGLEPSPRWLRARYAAANTWIPFGPEGVEPSSGPYKEPALAVELRAIGAGGATSVGREALESSSAAFQTAARPSQLPTQTKKARCRCDTGL